MYVLGRSTIDGVRTEEGECGQNKKPPEALDDLVLVFLASCPARARRLQEKLSQSSEWSRPRVCCFAECEVQKVLDVYV